MLTTSTFYQLSYTEQADTILREGNFIQTRTEKNFMIDMYELDDLLIEVFYQKDTEDLVSIMAYNTADKLQMLSKGINLTPRLSYRGDRTIYPAKECCA
ncbi:MAG TPA: hypothetical protein VEY10_07445 [Flavisolibacter sp.]|jgi:hypothetical protein|nr:hypothetical protein [Flavisolibacter sp.]